MEGIEPRKLDKLGKSFGFPVGPVTLTDEVGIDVGAHIGKYLTECFGERFAGANPEVLDSLVKAGITGNAFSFFNSSLIENSILLVPHRPKIWQRLLCL